MKKTKKIDGERDRVIEREREIQMERERDRVIEKERETERRMR